MNAPANGGRTRIGVDIGGTFTDVAAVGADGRLHIGKRLTTHGAEQEGVISAVGDCGVDTTTPDTILAHGTTLVINALLERSGARVALVTTEGFADVLDIGRGNRSEIFTLRFRRPGPLVPADLRFEVAERTAGDGRVERTPTTEELDELADRLRDAGVEAVAVGFLHSYLTPDNEALVADHLRGRLRDVPVTVSSDLSRQWREFERFTTATANAYVAPVAQRYLSRLTGGLKAEGFTGDFVVLDSSGGAMTEEVATRYPVRAVESGPVGGVIGARGLAAELGVANVVTFDMGGTTAKSALVENGEYATRDTYWIAGAERGFPLQVSTVDILEVGVGGGSIAWLDESGSLQVGPHSAGSQPGPACYGLGGTEPTLTDANLYCGRIDRDHFAGDFTLDEQAAATAIERLAEPAGMSPERLAIGIIRLANLRAASTIRRQTLERGDDPRDFTLLAIGGAGPLHACEIATEVGIGRVLVPRYPGHYSALGMLGANLRVDRREVLLGDLADLDPAALRASVAGITDELGAELGASGPAADDLRVEYAVAIRFRGQEHALLIAGPDPAATPDVVEHLRAAFEAEYVRRYGHLDTMSKAETVELQVVAERILPPVTIERVPQEAGEIRQGESIWGDGAARTPTVIRSRSSLSAGEELTGPAVLYEVGSTTALPPGAVATVEASGAVVIDVRGGST